MKTHLHGRIQRPFSFLSSWTWRGKAFSEMLPSSVFQSWTLSRHFLTTNDEREIIHFSLFLTFFPLKLVDLFAWILLWTYTIVRLFIWCVLLKLGGGSSPRLVRVFIASNRLDEKMLRQLLLACLFTRIFSCRFFILLNVVTLFLVNPRIVLLIHLKN